MKKHTPLVEEFMSTALITLREDDRLSQAVSELKLAAIRHLAIVDAKGKLAGVVSTHDLVGVPKGEDPPLRSVMRQRVTTVRPQTPAVDAIGLMIDGKFNSLPVVGEAGELVGIVTATDFLVLAQQVLLGQRPSRLASEI